MPTAPVVLITGASSGFGWAIAALLAESGWRVFGTSRRADALVPPGVTLLPLDVRDDDSRRACLRAVLDQTGRIDALVNNAGVLGPLAAIEETALAQTRDLFETNFFGVVAMSQAVIPHLRAQRSGTIVNIGSGAGLVAAPPFATLYAASKHALEAFSEGLRAELRPFGVNVAVVEPGYYRTSIHHSAQPPAAPLGDYERARRTSRQRDALYVELGRDPAEVARVVAAILEGRRRGLRHPVGIDALAVALARRFAPQGIVQHFMTWLFSEGDTPDPLTDAAQLDLPRRMIIDTRFGDRALLALAVALIGLAALRWGRGRSQAT